MGTKTNRTLGKLGKPLFFIFLQKIINDMFYFVNKIHSIDYQ